MNAARAGCIALTATLLAAAPAAAHDPLRAVAFSWTRGDGADHCPTQTALMASVRERMGRDPFNFVATVTAEALVERVAERWRARLIFRDESGTVLLRREFEDGAADCATIARAVVVSVSLALAPAPPTAPVVDGEVAPRPTFALPPSTPPPPRERARVTLAAEALVGPLPSEVAVGSLGYLSFGAVLRVDAPVATAWRLFGSVAFEPELRFGTARQWAFGMTRASAGGCVHTRSTRWWELSGCALVSLGLVHVVTFGPSPLEPGNYPWLAGGLEGHASARWRRLVVDLGLTVAPTFIGQTFTIGVSPTEEVVYKQELLNAALTLGAGIEF